MRATAMIVPVCFVLVAAPAAAATLTVGPGKTYAKPCAAIAAAAAGDIIEVDAAGSYDGDTCAWSTDDLTVRGVNGRAKIDLTGTTPAQQKGIFTIYAPTATVENFELSGAAISAGAGNNGAGIRHQGLKLTVRNCVFHDNQDGILGAPLSNGQPADGQGEVRIEGSEFSHNGAGDGFSHNMYINHYAKFTLIGSWSHKASVGHLVKTRADENYILYNRITDEDGTASYEIDVPNGGKTYIIGNLIQQGAASQNPTIIAYEEEGKSPTNALLELFVVNNSIVNDLGKGTFIHVGSDVTQPVVVQNNVFVGMGTVVDQASAVQTTNYAGNPMFLDQTNFDYHLSAGSPCVDKGTTPGMGDGYALTPTDEYVQPAKTQGRAIANVIDIGAYELGGAVDGGVGTGGGSGSGGASASATSTSSAAASSSSGSTGAGGAHPGAGGADGGTGASGTTGTPGAKSGCGCTSVGASSRGAGGVAALLLALGLVARRRPRSRGSRAGS